MRFLLPGVLTAVVLVVVGCGGSKQSSLHGQLFVKAGEKLTLEKGEQAFLSLTGLKPDGTLDMERTYPCHVNPDGSFQMAASGGELPPGTYRVSLTVSPQVPQPGKGPSDRFKGKYARERSKLKIEVKPGRNDLAIDLSSAGA